MRPDITRRITKRNTTSISSENTFEHPIDLAEILPAPEILTQRSSTLEKHSQFLQGQAAFIPRKRKRTRSPEVFEPTVWESRRSTQEEGDKLEDIRGIRRRGQHDNKVEVQKQFPKVSKSGRLSGKMLK